MPHEQEYNIIIEHESEGARLDKALSFALPDVSRSYIQRLIEMGMISLNDKTTYSKKIPVRTGDRLTVLLPEPETLNIVPQDLPLCIVYEDDQLLVIDKQKGMVVHPAPGNLQGTLVNGIMHHCEGNLSTINGTIRPGIVHRIDKDTSGLLMVAKTDAAHRSLAAQLAEHSIARAYKAIAWGNFPQDSGTVDAPIGRDPANRLRQKVTDRGGKAAVTDYHVLERFGRFTYLEARLRTGRTHQIRVHMSHLGHPLLGDYIYGPKKNPYDVDGQMLHAWLLGFIHPTRGEYMEFQSPLPEEFEKVLQKLREGR